MEGCMESELSRRFPVKLLAKNLAFVCVCVCACVCACVCVRVSVCVCLCPSTVGASSVWG